MPVRDVGSSARVRTDAAVGASCEFSSGEVRSAGQFPFVSGMTVQAAVAIAGGYADRADERRVQITRRHANGIVEKMDVPPDYLVRPGDTLYVYERWL